MYKINEGRVCMSDDKKEAQVVYLKLDDIIPNRFQPREVFDEGALEELSESIKEHGVIQPVIVRPKDGKYELIAGERRCKASALAGLTSVPAIVREMDDKESAKISLLENLQRKNLSAIEEARTYKKILELENMSQEQLAKTMGKSQPMIANKIRLLALPEEVQDALIKNQISERHARSLLTIKDKETQLMMLERIKNERLTVRELDAEIKKLGTNKESGDNTMPYNMDNNSNMMNNMNSQFSGVSNNYGNFNNMGLNDYQSGNSGMFNNIPNFNNNSQDVTPLMNNFTNDVPSPMNNFEEPKLDNVDYSNFNDNKDFTIPNMQNDMPNNNYSSLGSMFDSENGNSSNNNNNNNMNPNMPENNSNPFISQIREDTIKPKENQFLPNFDTPNNFNNQSNNNMNDFGMNSFLNSNSNSFNNNFESNMNNNFNNNNNNFIPNNNDFNNNFVPNNNNLNNNFMSNNNDFNNNFIPNSNNLNNNFIPNNNFSNPNQNPNFNMPSNNFQSNQGGLFNQPLNIVSVPNQDNYQDDNNQENQDKNLDFKDKKESFDNPFDDAYENILNAKPVSVNPEEEKSKEESEEDNTKEEIESNKTNEHEEEKTLDDGETKEIEKEDDIEKENDDTSSEEVELIGEETPKEESKKEDNYIRLEPEKTIFDARGAVYELKKTTDAIKQNNISIDTEEIEFDDYYQVIIKIKK